MLSLTGIGLDLGSRKIKIAKVKKKGSSIQLVSFGSRETPPGVIEAGDIKDPHTLGRVIAELVDQLGLKNKAVITALAGPQVYTRIITMPRLKLGELRKGVRYQAAAFLPIPVEQAAMDIFPIREFQDQEGARVELFFVAVRRSQVEKIKIACQLGHLKLQIIEIEPLALHRLFLDKGSQSAQALLDIGASRSCFSVYKEGVLIFNRNFSLSYSGYQNAAGFSYNEPRQLQSLSRGNINPIQDIVNEVARLSEYFRMQQQSELSKMLITGGGTRIAGLGEAIASTAKYDVEVGDLLSRISLSQQAQQGDLDELKYDFALAIGLAIRGGEFPWKAKRLG